MKVVTSLVAGLVLAASAGGCMGPQKMTRNMDDWANQTYVDNPWFLGNTLSWACLQVVFAATWALDLAINAIYFWTRDAWRGEGTIYEREPVVLPRRK